MQKLILACLASILLINCKKEREVDVTYVVNKLEEYSGKIEKVEYNLQRVDTFPQGTVWNNNGFALIEKDISDPIFGFAFYGKRSDVQTEYIYDRGVGFEISKSTKSYKNDKGNYGFMGSPGGQMVVPDIFRLDSVYKSVTLVENEENFILRYQFEDDTVHNVSKITKTIEVTKDNFFPVKITRTAEILASRSFSQVVLSNVKINDQVKNSIKNYKNEFQDYDIIQTDRIKPNRLLGKKIPAITLPNLLDQSRGTDLPTDRVTLIDFWEPWCGPCIASFSKVEDLKSKYASRLEIIGIVSEDSEAAIRLIEKKRVTFLNLVGDTALKEKFSIDSWPRYFLVDKEGVVLKEYFGFSEQIEKDIQEIVRL